MLFDGLFSGLFQDEFEAIKKEYGFDSSKTDSERIASDWKKVLGDMRKLIKKDKK